MNTQNWQRLGILLLLALVMAATRLNHFSPLATATWGPLPDASWAVFFVAGYYLRDWTRWAFPLLTVLAVTIDYYVISAQGISFWTHYCVSAAYWCLIPAHLALWLGGAWLARQRAGARLADIGRLAIATLVATTIAYLLSNGSFYWLSDSWLAADATRSFAGWFKNLGDWYLPYLRATAVYVAIAAALHVLTGLAIGRMPTARDQTATRR